MNTENVLLIVGAIGIAVYLVAALVMPERF
ncbi:MAG: potassium-transporting ATPase subunit F [Aeromicrobium sp.]|nr:MAG: potassium-transporting ATPase subunit F [Aeromicrobium sp.]